MDLPDRYHSIATRKLRGLLADRTAQCLMVVAAILGLCRVPWSSTQLDDSFYYYQKLTWKQNADVVILGDSRPMVALSPTAMSGDLKGLRIRNFSFSGVGYSADYLTAAEQVWDNERDDARIALLGITPRSLRRVSLKANRFTSSARTYTPLTYWKARWLSWVPQTWPALDRPFLKVLTHAGAPGDFKLYRDAYGWFEPCPQHADLAATTTYYRRIQNDPICPEIVDRVLDRVRRWSAIGIHVYGFRPPTCREMEALEDDFAEESFVRSFEAAGGRWISPPSDDLATYDASHLDADSVSKFSHRIARAVFVCEYDSPGQRYHDFDLTDPGRLATASLGDNRPAPPTHKVETSRTTKAGDPRRPRRGRSMLYGN